jgi:hypothetical protein
MPFGYTFGFSLWSDIAVSELQAPLPPNCNGCNLSRSSGLGSSAFARHYLRNHGCFLFLRVLRCFSSPGCPRTPMHSVCGTGPSRPVGSPIRTSTDQSSLTAPRGISVFAPSFVGSWRLGIHRAPFLPSPVLSTDAGPNMSPHAGHSAGVFIRYLVSKVQLSSPTLIGMVPSKLNTQTERSFNSVERR